jgi:hypothetical protein
MDGCFSSLPRTPPGVKKMGIEEQFDLHPESLAILLALADSTDPPKTEVPDVEGALARFACGWATTEEQDEVIGALISSSELRQRLVEMRQRIASAEIDLNTQVQVFEEDPVLARAMKSALAGCVSVLARWNESCQAAVQRRLDEDGERSVGSVLRGISRRMEDSGLVPNFAISRGGAHAKHIPVEPGNMWANLRVEMQEDESFVADATLSQTLREPKELSLYLVEPKGGWVWLGCNSVIGDKWTLEAGGFSALCNIPVQSITIDHFALAEGRFFQPRNWIPVWISDQLKRSKHIASPGKLRSTKGPSIHGQQLHVEMEFPEALREALEGSQMVMSVDLGSTSFVVGTWPVSQLPHTKEMVIDAALPGIPDCELEYQSAVTLMFR